MAVVPNVAALNVAKSVVPSVAVPSDVAPKKHHLALFFKNFNSLSVFQKGQLKLFKKIKAKIVFQKNSQEASRLSPEEELQKCPRCTMPCRVNRPQNIAQCTRIRYKTCHLMLSIECLITKMTLLLLAQERANLVWALFRL
jgi:hypothetical protein